MQFARSLAFLGGCALAGCAGTGETAATDAPTAPALVPLGVLEGEDLHVETLAVTADGMTALYTDPDKQVVGVVDLSDPRAPRLVHEIELPGEPTSVAIGARHPAGVFGTDAAVVVVIEHPATEADQPSTREGRLYPIWLREPRGRGEGWAPRIAENSWVPLGEQPDSLQFLAGVRHHFAVVAMENEPLLPDGPDGPPELLPGNVSDHSRAGRILTVTYDPDITSKHDIRALPLPTERLAEAGLLFPEDPQPEKVATHGSFAAITLQENNGVVVYDLSTFWEPELVSVFSTGIAASRRTDLSPDGEVVFTDVYPDEVGKRFPAPVDGAGRPLPGGLRMPDGIAFSPDGAALLTADEGDLPYSGGRGWSIWSLAGELLWSDAGELERAARARGLFPEHRAADRGIEIEGVATARLGGRDCAFLASERGSFLAVYDISDLRAPVLLDLLPTGVAPESIVVLPERRLVIASAEVDGRLTVFGVAPGGPLDAPPAATAPLDLPGDEWIAEPAPDWDAAFRRSSGWTGADGIYSFALSGADVPGGARDAETAFVFSDTFVGEVADGRRQPGTTMVNNTMAWLPAGAQDPRRRAAFPVGHR